MKKLILFTLIAGFVNIAISQVVVSRIEHGSGQPGVSGTENADKWANDIYHAPQYMPGYPTASSLWTRVIDVPCTKADDKLVCSGYNWTPDMGRGEYLMIRPIIAEPPNPIILTNTVTNTIIKEVIVPIATKPIKE